MAKKKVLVTGMSGRIGGAVLRHLGHKYDFTALNRRPMDGVRCETGDIKEFDSIRPHFDGQDVVVHLAASLGSDVTTKDTIDGNIWGAMNVYEGRQAGWHQTRGIRQHWRGDPRLHAGLAVARTGRW